MGLAPLSFRKATEKDIPELDRFINSAYRGESARAGWTNESDLVDGLRTTPTALKAIISQSQEEFLLAYSQNELVASVYLRNEERSLFFGMIAVMPSKQGQGIGSKVLMEIDRIARERGKGSVRMDVIHLRAELIAYYVRKGFSLTGASEEFPAEYPAKVPGLKLVEMKKTL